MYLKYKTTHTVTCIPVRLKDLSTAIGRFADSCIMLKILRCLIHYIGMYNIQYSIVQMRPITKYLRDT